MERRLSFKRESERERDRWLSFLLLSPVERERSREKRGDSAWSERDSRCKILFPFATDLDRERERDRDTDLSVFCRSTVRSMGEARFCSLDAEGEVLLSLLTTITSTGGVSDTDDSSFDPERSKPLSKLADS